MRFIYTLLIILIFPWSAGFAQFYNGTQNEFGKNRIQYDRREWQFYRFERFDCYFYKNGNELAAYVSEAAARNLNLLEEIFDYQLDDRLELIVYNKQSDFRLSNIGLSSDANFNIGGSTRLAGSKLILYYEGDHRLLEQQIRAGLAEVLFSQLLYGGSWKDAIRNSTLLNLPDWFTKGLVAYLSMDWSAETDAYVKDAILCGRFNRLNHLTGMEAVYAGHAIWKYIADTYGKSIFPNLIYMTRISRNVESGFNYVLGSTLKKLNEDFVEYYKIRYEQADKKLKDPQKDKTIRKARKNRKYYQYKQSPDGRYAAFASNELGQIKLFILDTETGKRKRIYKFGQKLDRIHDYSYPVLAWHPSSKLLAFITEQKGEVHLSYYNVDSRKIEKRPPLFAFEKILDFAYSDDGKKVVMSAVQKGQTDVFVYTLASNYAEQITKDLYDDIHPRFINNSSQIIFSSNRKDDTLRNNAKPVYYEPIKSDFDLFMAGYKTKSPTLLRVTNTPNQHEFHPLPTGINEFIYQANEGRGNSLYIARFDSTLAYVDTTEHYRYFSTSKALPGFSRDALEHHVYPGGKTGTRVYYFKGRHRLATEPIPAYDFAGTAAANESAQVGQSKEKNPVRSSKNDPSGSRMIQIKEYPANTRFDSIRNLPGHSNIYDYKFYNEAARAGASPAASKPASDSLVIKKVTAAPGKTTFSEGLPAALIVQPGIMQGILPKTRQYFRVYLFDQVVTQFDNNFINPTYQKFTGSEVYFNPGLNGLFKIGLSDVLEDYRIVGGFRLSTDLKSNESFISYEMRPKRWDKGLMYYRQSFPATRTAFDAPKVLTQQFRGFFKYPFNEVLSLRFTPALRMDRTTYLSTDAFNLSRKQQFDFWASGKSELVYDDTRSLGLNLMTGCRAKAFVELFNRIDSLESRTWIVGLDYRRYFRVWRNLIWANRFAASTSFGPEKLIYYLGAVDNWLNLGSRPTFNTGIPIDTENNYVFQALASNLRGFNQNIRNGNSFALVNTELRWPVFQTLFNRPLKSDFMTNFQLVAFGDIGTAWTGLTPYSSDNSFNTQTITNGPVTVFLKRQQDPIVGGFGWGMRSRILGYFLRADWAWGVDDLEVQPRVFYLSLSLDF